MLLAFGMGLLGKFCFHDSLALWFIPIVLNYVLLNLISYSKEYKSSDSVYSFKVGYCFGVSYFFASLYWVHESFNCVDSPVLGYISTVALACYLAIFPAITCLITSRLQKTRLDQIIFFSVIWTVMELIRGILFTGFPWNLTGYVIVDVPYINQALDIVGIYGMSLIVMLITSLISYVKTAVVALIMIASLLSYGLVKNKLLDGNSPFFYTRDFKPEISKTQVTIVQPAIPQKDRLDATKVRENLDSQIYLSGFGETNSKNRVIVWCETAIGGIIEDENSEQLKYVAKELKKGEVLVAGSIRYFRPEKKFFNSLFVISNKGKILEQYDKNHLLPFGEFIPNCISFLPFDKIIGENSFTHGDNKRYLKIGDIPEFMPVICYEIAFPGEIIPASSQRPKWILNITNDSWFGNTDGPYQHLRAVRARAIEEGIPIIRCSNDGISCVVNAKGNIVASLLLGESGVINTNIPKYKVPTLYSVYGNNIVYVFLMGLFVFGLFISLRSKNQKHNIFRGK